MSAAVDMRIYGRRGIGRYNAQLHEGLSASRERLRVTFFGRGRPEWQSLRTDWYVLQEQVEFPLRLAAGGYDVVHLTANTAPLIQAGWPALVVTVHDVMYLKPLRAYPLSPSWRQNLGRAYRAFAFLTGTRRAARLIVDSAHTAADLHARFGSHLPPIDVVYPAIDPIFFGEISGDARDAACLRYDVRPKEFFVHPGAIDPRKNTIVAVKAFDRYVASGGTSDLVVFGLRPENGQRLLQDMSAAGRQRVRMLPWIADQELVALLQAAGAMIFVPADEGFGYPLLEAMAGGTPAIASSLPVLHEISAGHASWVEPNDSGALVDKLGGFRAEDDSVRASVERAQTRAGEFTVEAMAAATIASYERAAQTTA